MNWQAEKEQMFRTRRDQTHVMLPSRNFLTNMTRNDLFPGGRSVVILGRILVDQLAVRPTLHESEVALLARITGNRVVPRSQTPDEVALVDDFELPGELSTLQG